MSQAVLHALIGLSPARRRVTSAAGSLQVAVFALDRQLRGGDIGAAYVA